MAWMSSVSTHRCRSPGAESAAPSLRPPNRTVWRIAARRLPNVAQAQPAAGDFVLSPVAADDLREDAIVIADPVPDRGVMQCRQRIRKQAAKRPQAAVSQTGSPPGPQCHQFMAHAAQAPGPPPPSSHPGCTARSAATAPANTQPRNSKPASRARSTPAVGSPAIAMSALLELPAIAHRRYPRRCRIGLLPKSA